MPNSKTAKPDAEDASAKLAPVKRTEKAPSMPVLPDAEPPEEFSGLAREYIGLSIAGGLVVGVLIGALFPRSAAKKLARQSSRIAAVAGELGMAYATQAFAKAGEAAREGREKAIDMGEVIAERSAEARDKAGKLVEDGAGRARVTGALLARKAAEIVAKARS